MRQSIRAFGVCPAIALLLTACDVRVGDNGVSVGVASGKASDQWVRTYTLQPGGQLEIVSDGGPIDVAGTDGTQIEIRIERDARAGSDELAREALKSVEIAETTSAGGVRVETRGPGGGQGGRGFRRAPVSVRYAVRLPRGAAASFRTQNGGIKLENVRGRLQASTTNGGVTGSGLEGAVSAAVVNGGVQLQLTSVTDPMELTVVNGGIRLELSRDTKATVSASAINGGVTVDDALGLTREAGSSSGQGRVSGTLNGGGPKITAQATNGGVRLLASGAPVEAPRRP
jgi:putative adhesin